MAGELVRQHHAFDAVRFLLIEGVENGYARFFERALPDDATILLLAERAGKPVGYAYGRLEPRDWNALLDACGALHDIFVVEGERRRGVARALLNELVARFTARGAPRMILMTAIQNAGAQALFERQGFRRTMIEMVRELG
jgi:ribosomal protein S18 acetylase RimI-like enzyme